jgi:hypothetical protein
VALLAVASITGPWLAGERRASAHAGAAAASESPAAVHVPSSIAVESALQWAPPASIGITSPRVVFDGVPDEVTWSPSRTARWPSSVAGGRSARRRSNA